MFSSRWARRALFAAASRGPWAVGLMVSCHGEEPTARVLGFPLAPVLEAPGWALVDAFPRLRFNTAVGLYEAPGSDHLIVLERDGRVYAFRNDEDVGEKRLVLDLSSRTQGRGDSGLLGFAFHPEFNQHGSANRGYVYLHYAFNERPARSPKWNAPTHSRLARFVMDPDTLVIEPSSELVLIDQTDDSTWHQGGAMFFHPEDGFLYLSVGDEGGSACEFQNCQRIDKDLFSGVLRIDVDQRGGDISHPIPRQPATGTTQSYYIPNENPFVGQEGVLEEFYAIGLRSPHRMAHDPLDGLTWIGDVGDLQREEIDVLAAGANYQWPVMEGLQPGFGLTPQAPLGTWTAPVHEVSRSDGRAIIGGYVYRGEQLPQLRGKYLFGDFVTGNIWALPYEYDGTTLKPAAPELLLQSSRRGLTGDGLTSVGSDAQGEPYLMFLGKAAPIYRLARAVAETNVPRRLSETGVFTDTAGLAPAAELMPYTVHSPLYSDGAHKQRWIALPADGDRIGFSDDGPWEFPEGTLFIKHFEMALDERDPSRRSRLETRVLIAGSKGYYAVTFRWNDAGDDADLVVERQDENLEIVQADGSVRSQTYTYPGPSDCMQCHNEQAGHVLGVRTAQLSGGSPQPGASDGIDQLQDWSDRGLFDAAVPVQVGAAYPRLASLEDESRSVEERVRSYWDSNCSMCHGVTEIHAAWDARFTTPLSEQGVLLGEPYAGPSADGVFLIRPGDPSRSLMYQRTVTAAPEWRMPPLGRNRTDDAYVYLLERWISSLPAPAQ